MVEVIMLDSDEPEVLETKGVPAAANTSPPQQQQQQPTPPAQSGVKPEVAPPASPGVAPKAAGVPAAGPTPAKAVEALPLAGATAAEPPAQAEDAAKGAGAGGAGAEGEGAQTPRAPETAEERARRERLSAQSLRRLTEAVARHGAVLGQHWTAEAKIRQGGNTKGSIDTYFRNGKRSFRSIATVLRYLELEDAPPPKPKKGGGGKSSDSAQTTTTGGEKGAAAPGGSGAGGEPTLANGVHPAPGNAEKPPPKKAPVNRKPAKKGGERELARLAGSGPGVVFATLDVAEGEGGEGQRVKRVRKRPAQFEVPSPVARPRKKHKSLKDRKVKADKTATGYTGETSRVRALLSRMRQEQQFQDVYEAEGWKGANAEKLKPVAELRASRLKIARAKQAIRGALRRCDEAGGDHRIPAEFFDASGELDEEHIQCCKCRVNESDENNDIVLCDGECSRAYHEKCLDPPLVAADLPEDEGWLCPACDAKADILTLLNDEFDAGYEQGTPWEAVFPEADAEAAGQGGGPAAPGGGWLGEDFPDSEPDDVSFREGASSESGGGASGGDGGGEGGGGGGGSSSGSESSVEDSQATASSASLEGGSSGEASGGADDGSGGEGEGSGRAGSEGGTEAGPIDLSEGEGEPVAEVSTEDLREGERRAGGGRTRAQRLAAGGADSGAESGPEAGLAARLAALQDEQVELLEGKRTRPKVDYAQLYAETWGGVEDAEEEGDTEFQPTGQPRPSSA